MPGLPSLFLNMGKMKRPGIENRVDFQREHFLKRDIMSFSFPDEEVDRTLTLFPLCSSIRVALCVDRGNTFGCKLSKA